MDVEELFADATRVVVADQVDAGLDILSDGELRRQRFVYEMYQHIQGLERRPPLRRLGINGYDMAPSFLATQPLTAPYGFGLVEEFATLACFLASDAAGYITGVAINVDGGSSPIP